MSHPLRLPVALSLLSAVALGQRAERWIVHFDAQPPALGALRVGAEAEARGAAIARLEGDARVRKRRLSAAVARLGGRVLASWWIVNAAAVELPADKVGALGNLPGVQRLERDRLVYPTIKTATNASNHNSDALQRVGVRGGGVSTAILDTGHDVAIGGSACVSRNTRRNIHPNGSIRPNVKLLWLVRVRAPANLRVSGFQMLLRAERPMQVKACLYSEVGGQPGAVLRTGTLSLQTSERFAAATFSSSVQFQKDDYFYIGFDKQQVGRIWTVCEGGDYGDVSFRYANTQNWLRLPFQTAWHLVCDGSGRPHRSYYENGDPSRRNRLAAARQIGRLAVSAVSQHGLATAGIAAGGRWGSASADYGHAYAADIVGYSLADQSSGGSFLSTLVTAWQQLLLDVAKYRIVTALNPYSGSWDPTSVVQQALDRAARLGDVLVVTSAGNSPTNVTRSQVNLNGVTVGAVTADAHGLATFTPRVASWRGHAFPDLVANGVGVTMPRAGDEAGDYTASGSSFAAAQVCGIATAVRASARSLGADETKAVLLAATEQSPGAGATMQNGAGAGYLRADRALTIARSRSGHGRGMLTAARPVRRFSMFTTRNNLEQVAIVWHRRDTTTDNVSNLDLRVFDPRGNLVGSSVQPYGTEEFVRFRPRQTGEYRIEIRATSIVGSAQRFAWASGLSGLTGPTTSIKRVGCKGSGFSSTCPKQNPSADASTPLEPLVADTKYALLVQCDCRVTVTGFRLFAAASSNVTIDTALYTDGSDADNEPDAQRSEGTMMVQTAAGLYQTTLLTPVTVEPGQIFFLTFTTPSSVEISAPAGILPGLVIGHHFSSPGDEDEWTGSLLSLLGERTLFDAHETHSWAWSVQCTSDCDGLIPSSSYSGQPVIGSNFAFQLAQAKPLAPYLLLTGASQSRLSLTPLGAPTCWLMSSGELVTVGLTSGSGAASVVFPLPNDPLLIGVRLFQQYAIVDSAANSLGVYTGDLGTAILGR